MTTETYIEEEVEFAGDIGSITGNAVYDITLTDDWDRGLTVDSAELLHVDLGGVKIARDVIAQLLSEKRLQSSEDFTATQIQEQIDAGDFFGEAA